MALWSTRSEKHIINFFLRKIVTPLGVAGFASKDQALPHMPPRGFPERVIPRLGKCDTLFPPQK